MGWRRPGWVCGVGLGGVCALAAVGVACAGRAPSPDPGSGSTRVGPAPLPAPWRSTETALAEAWLDVERPLADGATVVGMEWLEVRGVAGSRQYHAYDVAIVVDVSGSTRYASGADVNGNGLVGVRRAGKPWEVWSPIFDCSDPGDSVLDAELAAVGELIDRLDPRRSRIALLTFSDRAQVRAPLGASREQLSRVLEDMNDAFGAGATNLAEATRLGTRLLLEGAAEGPSPGRVLLLLSDGDPNEPRPEARAFEAAIEAAGEARAADVRISAFALGPDVKRDPDVYARMAAETGGEHVRVETPGDVLHALPRIDLARVAKIEIENLTTRRPGRLRMRPDGGFDAYLQLAPGENRLRVTARGRSGQEVSEERVVTYDDSLPPNPEALADVQRKIELRTLEIELEREVRMGREQRKRLDLETSQ